MIVNLFPSGGETASSSAAYDTDVFNIIRVITAGSMDDALSRTADPDGMLCVVGCTDVIGGRALTISAKAPDAMAVGDLWLEVYTGMGGQEIEISKPNAALRLPVHYVYECVTASTETTEPEMVRRQALLRTGGEWAYLNRFWCFRHGDTMDEFTGGWSLGLKSSGSGTDCVIDTALKAIASENKKYVTIATKAKIKMSQYRSLHMRYKLMKDEQYGNDVDGYLGVSTSPKVAPNKYNVKVRDTDEAIPYYSKESGFDDDDRTKEVEIDLSKYDTDAYITVGVCTYIGVMVVYDVWLEE